MTYNTATASFKRVQLDMRAHSALCFHRDTDDNQHRKVTCSQRENIGADRTCFSGLFHAKPSPIHGTRCSWGNNFPNILCAAMIQGQSVTFGLRAHPFTRNIPDTNMNIPKTNSHYQLLVFVARNTCSPLPTARHKVRRPRIGRNRRRRI